MNNEFLELRRDLQKLISKYNDLESRYFKNQTPGESAAKQPAATPSSNAARTSSTPYAPTIQMGDSGRESSTGNLFGIIGAICFILGAAFLIKLAINDGWLTEFRQYALSQLLSVILIGVGIKLHSIDKNYSGILAGTGVVVGFMAAFAGYGYFHVLSQGASLGVTIAVALLSVWLRDRFQSESFPVLGSIGTFLSPLLLDFKSSELLLNASYFLLWCVGFSVIATKIKSRVTILVAAYFSMGSFLMVSGGTSLDAQNIPTIAGVLCAQFVIFLGAVASYSVLHQKSLEKDEASAFFPLLIFFYGIEYFLLNRWIPEYTPWIGIGFGTLVIGAYFVARNKLGEDDLHSSTVAWGMFSVCLFHSGYLNLVPQAMKPYLMLALLSSVFALKPSSKKIGAALPLACLFLLICLLEIGGVVGNLLWENPHPQSVWIALASAGLIGALYVREESEDKKSFAYPVLITTHALVMISLFRLVESFGSLGVSFAWCAYSLFVLVLGFTLKDKLFAKSSALCLLVSAGKALTYDVAAQTSTIRVLCLLFTGALLYGTGLAFKKIENIQEN